MLSSLAPAQESKPKGSTRLDPALVSEFGGKKSATKGHRDSWMGFSLPTQVTEVLVKGGQEVKKGTLLIKGDDAEDIAVFNLQKAKADSDWPVQRAKKQADLAKIEFDRLKKIHDDNQASSTQEVERAELTWQVALIDFESAKVQQTQEVMQVVRLQARVDKLHLVAPFDGIVDEVKVDVGQNVSENEKQVLRVVDVDPLIADVPAPMDDPATQTIKVGDKAWVLLDVANAARVMEGTVTEVAPTMDLSALARRVRIEIPNPKGPQRILAGEPAYVRFSQPPAGVMAKVTAAIKAETGKVEQAAR